MRDFMEILDARLMPEHEPSRAPKRGETEQAAMRAQGRQRLADERRRLYDQQRLKPPLEFRL